MTDRGATPLATLEKIYKLAKELGLRFPYLGNVYNHPYENTYCPVCGVTLIERQGFSSKILALDGQQCRNCGDKDRDQYAMSPNPVLNHSSSQIVCSAHSAVLRFMGYDTVSANGLDEGNAKEDILLLNLPCGTTASCSRATLRLRRGVRIMRSS